MDILANVNKHYRGANSELVFWYKPMPQSLKNEIQHRFVSDSVKNLAEVNPDTANVKAVTNRKLLEVQQLQRVENNVLAIRACFIGITSPDGEPVMFGDVDLAKFPRVQDSMGGLPCSMLDSDFLGKVLDAAPDLGADIWMAAEYINNAPVLTRDKVMKSIGIAVDSTNEQLIEAVEALPKSAESAKVEEKKS